MKRFDTITPVQGYVLLRAYKITEDIYRSTNAGILVPTKKPTVNEKYHVELKVEAIATKDNVDFAIGDYVIANEFDLKQVDNGLDGDEEKIYFLTKPTSIMAVLQKNDN